MICNIPNRNWNPRLGGYYESWLEKINSIILYVVAILIAMTIQ